MKLKNLAVIGLVLVGAVGAVITWLVLAAVLPCSTDKCEGTFSADVIKGYGIPDGGGSEIRGDGGDDNPDTIESCTGSCGNDRIAGQDDEEGDVIWGDDSSGGITNTGHDYIVAMDGDDVVHGEAGNDRIMGGIGEDHLFGGLGNDRMDGGEDDDNAIQGDAGSDIIYGRSGDDTIYGDSDDPDAPCPDSNVCHDRLYGDKGDDDIFGGPGNDVLEGGLGADHLVGGAADGVAETDIYNIRAIFDAPAANSASDTEVIECTVEEGDTGIVVLRGFPRGTPTGGVGSPITIADPNGVSFYNIIPGPGTCIIRRR